MSAINQRNEIPEGGIFEMELDEAPFRPRVPEAGGLDQSLLNRPVQPIDFDFESSYQSGSETSTESQMK